MDLSIIIINYNTVNLTYNCILSIIEKNPKNLSYEIIVVDNASKHEDYQQLKQHIEALNSSNISLFRSNINSGFSGGNMMGVQFAKGNYLAFINNDVLLINDSFTSLIEYFENHKDTGVIGLQPIFKDGKKQIPFSHFHSFKVRFLGYWLYEKLHPKVPKRHQVYENPIKVDFVVGSFMLFRATDFYKIGGFDTNIFLYYEEMDICQRLKKINLNAVFFPQIEYIHINGASTNLGYQKKVELKISHLYVVRKNNGYFSYLFLKLLFIFEYFFKAILKPMHFKMLYKLLTFGPVLASSLKNEQKILELQSTSIKGKKKITIISFDNWGFNNYISNALQKKGHFVNHIDFNKFKYQYPNFLYKFLNFFLKVFLKKNIKKIYYGKAILKQLELNSEKQDLILIIKADFIDKNALWKFKKFTKKSVAFINDNIARYPTTKNVLECFDEVYSFEKRDCEKYNLKFLTNFIYNFSSEKNSVFENELFNISSKDKRTPIILKIAENLKNNDIKYKILIFDKKMSLQSNKNVTIINKHIDLKSVNEYIKNSKTMLDVHKKNQNGLSFRVFESLGASKKLITTNTDIKNYDFYNPNNIFVIENDDFVIEKSFFKTDYEPIPENILKKYVIDNWVEEFLN